MLIKELRFWDSLNPNNIVIWGIDDKIEDEIKWMIDYQASIGRDEFEYITTDTGRD
jgi:hypothetical protein